MIEKLTIFFIFEFAFQCYFLPEKKAFLEFNFAQHDIIIAKGNSIEYTCF